MDLQEIETQLRAALGPCDINISAEGNKLALRIVSEAFAGLSRVKRQQLVYKVVNARIASGELHAVSMQTVTPDEVPSP